MNVIAIVGLESIKDADGNVKYFAETFLNNIKTWRRDNPDAEIKIFDGRSYSVLNTPVSSLWKDIANAYGEKGIDQILYSGHSDSDKLYWISKARHDLPDTERFLWERDWNFTYNKDASIKLMGCQTGGQEGKKWPKCIAQSIADSSGVIVWGFTSKSSQKKRDGGYYQTPDIGGYVKFVKD